MKKYLILLSVALSMLLPAATSLAADLDTLPPPPPPPVDHLRPATYDWSGAYVGAYVGMACMDGSITDSTTSLSYLNAGCGVKGGGLVGYNVQMDQFVFGIEGNLETTGNLVYNMQTGADFKFGYDYIGRVNGRFGYAMDSTLFFLQAGGAYGMGHLVDNVSLGGSDERAGQWGWSVGAGVESAVTDSLRLRFDYLYTQFQDTHFTGCGGCDVHGGGNEHEVRAAAIWAF
ncbi:outer membrane protein [Aestuariivirga litoralis]|uniref:outer membrane protein n=1 Tax=Aestuariivirga litoralis TaxID=2650924 RepID=UPI0018C77440|nr:outer membrane beta-barrel protein [Aestuariivirga litoralis]MBG1231310.1 porin family protein [Aestuariivirga litoralis]